MFLNAVWSGELFNSSHVLGMMLTDEAKQGYGTAKILALHGATVFMACRSLEKCEAARRKIVDTTKGAVKANQLICEKLNLSSLKDVKRYGEVVRSSGIALDSLILNAGVMYPPYELTEDGLESTWGINHVAHFLLTHELLPVLRKAPKATIVSVASNAQFLTDKSDDISTFNDEATYNIAIQYGRSKLANVLFAQELAKKVGPNILVNSLNPGGVRGDLYRHLPFGLRHLAEFMQDIVFWSEEQSALTVIGCAWNPKVFQEHITGKYFVPVWREDIGCPRASNTTLAKLWFEETEKLLRAKKFL
jgi:retinol dehydrogenase-12